MIHIFATEVTEENTPSIIEWMRNFNLNVTDDLDDIVGFYEQYELGAPYAILSVDRKTGHEDIAKFSVLSEKDFVRNYQFSGLDTGLFKHVIKRVGA